MPDDERLGGTPDPQEYGRRHRRDDDDEQPRRRRRSMEAGGGLSVADLVQKHSASRADLRPVTPEKPLQQNTLMHGRRSRQDPPRQDPPSARPIADALNGHDGFPQDVEAPRRSRRGESSAHHAAPAEPAPRRRTSESSAPRNGFPPDEPRSRRAAENGFPQGTDAPRRQPAPGEGSGPRRRRAQEPAAGFPPEAPGRNGFPADDGPRRGGARRAAEAPNGFPADEAPGRRGIEAGFPADAPRRGARRPGKAANGFPADDAADDFPPEAPRRKGARRAADPNGFPADEAPGRKRGRRSAEAANGFPADGFAPDAGAPSRNVFADSGPNHNGFPPDAGAPGRNSFADGFGDGGPAGPNGFPADPGRNGARRVGEASAHLPFPGEGPGQRRVGEASAHLPFPGEGSGPRRVGEASTQLPRFPADAPGRQPGQASGRFPVDDPRRQGPPTPPPLNRAPGQATGARPMPGPDGPLSEPRLTPAAIDAPDTPRSKINGVPPVPLPPPRRGDEDAISMTTEMEAIGEEVQKRRSIDHTLMRFSAVHDELKAEEREKKAKRRKLMPWQADDDDMARLDELDAQQSMALQIPVVEPEPMVELAPPEDDETPPTRLDEKKLRRKIKGKLAGKVLAAVAAILVFVATAAAWGFKSYIESSAQTVDALDPDSQAIQDAAAQRGDENFLLVGSDTRAGATAEEGVGDETAIAGARSDTVMIAHVPKDRQRVVVVSFPRDLEVTRPACEGWDAKSGKTNGQQHPAAERVKLNTAYQIGGPKCVTKMVQELSGLAVNHFVGIDFGGFKGMVEAVQGVEVCVERPLKDDVLGTVVPEAGKNVKLTGDQALNFVRARHVDGDLTSDYGRIIRQQRFLSSLLRKAMSTEVLLNPGKLTSFVNAFSKSTFGDNIGVDQLFTLGQSMQGVDTGRVTFITVPTVGEANKRGNEDLKVEDTNALFEAVRQDTPLPGEAPAKPADDASKNNQASGLKQEGPVDPKNIKIQVLNGGNETGGIAGDTGDALEEFGFQIMRVGPAPENIDKTAVIKYSKTRTAEAQTLQKAVPGSVLQEDPALAGAIMLIVGPGFDGEVVSPTGGAPVPELPDNLQHVNAGDVSCA